MIKFRQKEFVYYDPKEWDQLIDLDPDKKKFYNITVSDKIIPNPLYKSKIKRLKKDLREGWVYKDSPGNSDDTEYLYQISDERYPGGFLVYSKNIAGDDRFCYIIYPPQLAEFESKNGEVEEIYIVEVFVYSYTEHRRPDGGLYWSPFPEEMRKIKQEINQWRRKRNLPEI